MTWKNSMFYTITEIEEYDPWNMEVSFIEIQTSIGSILVALINSQQEEHFIKATEAANFRPVRLEITDNDLTGERQKLIIGMYP